MVKGQRTHHGFHCSFCGKKFSDSSTLSRHVKVIHEQRFRYFCNICGKGMRDAGNLRGHMAIRHGKPKDYMCEICFREFAYKCQLVKHMTAHQNLNINH